MFYRVLLLHTGECMCFFLLPFCFSSARLSCDYRCKNVIIFVNSRAIYLCNVYRTYINKNAIHTHTFEKLTSMGDHKVYIKWKMSGYYQNDGSSNSSKTPKNWSDCLSNFLMVNALVLSSRLAGSRTHTIICNYFGHHRKTKWSSWDVISIINRIFAYFCGFELDLNPLQFLVEFYFKCLFFILAVVKRKVGKLHSIICTIRICVSTWKYISYLKQFLHEIRWKDHLKTFSLLNNNKQSLWILISYIEYHICIHERIKQHKHKYKHTYTLHARS